jgi:hypothetical protein
MSTPEERMQAIQKQQEALAEDLFPILNEHQKRGMSPALVGVTLLGLAVARYKEAARGNETSLHGQLRQAIRFLQDQLGTAAT